MLFPIVLLVLGLVLLIKGADWLVDGASALAKKFNISDLAIGLTIVAFGTSAPELVVNTFASFQGHQDIVFGNVIGSNIFNLFAVLGVAGLITPLLVQSSTVWKEIPISFFALIVLFVLSNDFLNTEIAILSRFDGFILLTLFALFLYYVYKQLQSNPEEEDLAIEHYSTLKTVFLIVGGLTGLVIGGRLVVDSAVDIALQMGLSEKMVGLTIVAAGTSLPELATSVIAALRKNVDIAVGNIVGSNIFNIFLILGASSIVSPILYQADFNSDMYLLGMGTLLLFAAMFNGMRKRLDRWEAGLLFLGYVGYMVFIVMKEL